MHIHEWEEYKERHSCIGMGREPGKHVLEGFFRELEKISYILKQDLPNVGTAPAMLGGPAIGSDPTAKPKIPGAMKIPKAKGLKMPSMSSSMKMPRAPIGKM